MISIARIFTLPLFLFLGACASIAVLQLNDRFGEPDPAHFDHVQGTPPKLVPDYWSDVRPVLDRRCVSCHACSDAPCQLNLTSYEGLTRGASQIEVYGTPRLVAEAPTRLGIDAQSVLEWRSKGFFPVLNERIQTPEANRQGGVMYRLLAQKHRQTLPPGRLNDPDIDFSLNRTAICTTAEGVDDYLRHHPTRGMPFALPPLEDREFKTLTQWLEAGSPYRQPPPLPKSLVGQIEAWEAFLNGDSKKEQLVARYIYEHWFIGHFWFPEMPEQFFELVRSQTPPGKAVSRIATRRPYDDPGVERVYYRFVRLNATPVAKTHMPLRLDPDRLSRLHHWFISPDYAVTELPGYAPEVASNPFVSFHALPLQARYRLMLEEAQFTLMGFMKSPVCRGQVALNAIDDHFWVFFVAPNEKESALMQQLIDGAMPTLRLPSEQQSTTGLLAWMTYAQLERQYLDSKQVLINKLGKKGTQPTLDDLWDGDGTNPNAALTVFRHFDSASVVRGLIGDRPQTAFVMGYPLLERMHYLLTAGFDVYGNIGHQLATRLYMDFLRMESELNFLVFLPLKDRQAVLDHWYRKRSEPRDRYFADATAHFPEETGVRYRTPDTLTELYALLQKRLAPLSESQLGLSASKLGAPSIRQLERLRHVHGLPASLLPENSLLLVTRRDGTTATISIVRNSAHANVAELLDQEGLRLPEEDSLTVENGIIGAYPNAFFTVDQSSLGAFISAIEQLKSLEDLGPLTDRFGIRRTDPRFWSVSDRIHIDYHQNQPTEFGILDYSRLDNH
jgi:hypothetical protein